MPTALDRRRRDARHRLSIPGFHRGEVANDEDLRKTGHSQVVIDNDAAGPVERHIQCARQRRGSDPRGPDHAMRADALSARDHALGVDFGDRRLQAQLDAHLAQAPFRRRSQPGIVGAQHVWPRLEQDHARPRRIDVAEVTRQHMSRNLGQRPRHLHAGRSGTHHNEGQPMLAPGRIGLALRRLVGEQDAAPDLKRVFDGLQSGSSALPFRVAKVRMGRSGSENEKVISQLTIKQMNDFRRAIDRDRGAQHHLAVELVAQDMPDRRGDIAGIQRRRRHLIEQWLKEVVVALVHQRDLHLRPAERLRRIQPAKSAAENDDVRKLRQGTGDHR